MEIGLDGIHQIIDSKGMIKTFPTKEEAIEYAKNYSSVQYEMGNLIPFKCFGSVAKYYGVKEGYAVETEN
jgi:hypothetical protein